MPQVPATTLRVEPLRGPVALHEATSLYTRVFGYRDPDYALNPNLLSALSKNGGSVIGVYTDEDVLVGFVYGFAARDRAGRDLHYSQAAVVDDAYQGRGIGRLLKEGQRAIARGWGHRTMRWTFDPMLSRNAHFNLSSLGAEGVACETDYYDRPGTDRLIVDWDLEREVDPFAAQRGRRPPSLGPNEWGRPQHGEVAGDVWIALPSTDGPVEPAYSARVRDVLREVLADGHVLIACQRASADTAAYLAVPARVGA